MEVYKTELSFRTGGDGDIIDLTGEVREKISDSGINDGTATVFVPGSTGAVTTVEYEPGLLRDLPEFFEKIIPSKTQYNHDKTWGDGNGYAHLRASLVGPSLTFPVIDGSPVLGTWQQIIFLEFDNRDRNRRIFVTVIGE